MIRKFKNYVISLFLLLICILGLAACKENENYEEYQPTQGSMFICIESYEDPYLGNVKILVDRETRIMYMYAVKKYADQESSCITVIYTSKGEPKKYNGVLTE